MIKRKDTTVNNQVGAVDGNPIGQITGTHNHVPNTISIGERAVNNNFRFGLLTESGISFWRLSTIIAGGHAGRGVTFFDFPEQLSPEVIEIDLRVGRGTLNNSNLSNMFLELRGEDTVYGRIQFSGGLHTTQQGRNYAQFHVATASGGWHKPLYTIVDGTRGQHPPLPFSVFQRNINNEAVANLPPGLTNWSTIRITYDNGLLSAYHVGGYYFDPVLSPNTANVAEYVYIGSANLPAGTEFNPNRIVFGRTYPTGNSAGIIDIGRISFNPVSATYAVILIIMGVILKQAPSP